MKPREFSEKYLFQPETSEIAVEATSTDKTISSGHPCFEVPSSQGAQLESVEESSKSSEPSESVAKQTSPWTHRGRLVIRRVSNRDNMEDPYKAGTTKYYA